VSDSRSIVLFTGYDKKDLIDHLTARDWHISAVVIPRSRKYLPGLGNLVTSTLARGIPVRCLPPGELSGETFSALGTVMVSAGYPFLIPQEVIRQFAHAINCHPTLLPRHRGKYLNYVLLEEDETSGVTVHNITEDLDAGPILKQLTFPVSKFDTLASLRRKSQALEGPAIVSALESLIDGTATATAQEHHLATLHVESRTPEDSQMSGDMPLLEALNIVRASDANHFPAYFLVDGQRVNVYMERQFRPVDEMDMI
jgi:methionyl-tRNA formyltransferase